MKNQYDILLDIKKIENKMVRLHAEAVHIPEDISKIDSVLNQKRSEFTGLKTKFESEEKELRAAERDLKEKEEFLRKAESKMMEVKTNEEYKAAMKENESHVKDKAKLEEKVLTLMNQLDGKRGKLKELEGTFKETETTLLSDKARLEEERKKNLRLLEEQMALRNDLTRRLEPNILTQYEKLSSRSANSAAIAYVDHGMCLDCSMKVRPQSYNEIIGLKAIHRCGNCGKILVLKPSTPAEEANS